MRVRDWMSPDPVTVTPSTHVAEARQLLDSYGVRHLPVVEHGRVVGMISDRDVRVSSAALRQATERLAATRRAAVAEDAGVGLVVSAVMSAPVHVVTADEDVEAAARLMLSRRLVPRTSFFQLTQVRKARDAGVPLRVIAHEDVLVFRRPDVDR